MVGEAGRQASAYWCCPLCFFVAPLSLFPAAAMASVVGKARLGAVASNEEVRQLAACSPAGSGVGSCRRSSSSSESESDTAVADWAVLVWFV